MSHQFIIDTKNGFLMDCHGYWDAKVQTLESGNQTYNNKMK